MRFSFAWMPTTQFLVNDLEPEHRVSYQANARKIDVGPTIGKKANTLKNILGNHRFEDIQL